MAIGMGLRPLDGYVVAVTADRRREEQAQLLARRGASVMAAPTITTDYLADDDDLKVATKDLISDPPEYLVATTGIGIRAWMESVAAWGLDGALVDALRATRIVARGPKAVAALQMAGLEPWARSPNEQMEPIVGMLASEGIAGRRVAIQEYGTDSPWFAGALADAGARVVNVLVYRWRLPDDVAPAGKMIAAAIDGRVDAITFTTAPALRNLLRIAADLAARDDLLAAMRSTVSVACVGPVCALAAREAGIDDPVVPPIGRLGLLVRALSEALEARRRVVRLGGQEIVIQGSAVEIEGERLDLSVKERGVLEMLSRVPGRVITRRDLLERLWGSSAADAHLLEATVTRLRRRLGAHGSAVQAVPGRGYQLDPDALV